MIGKVEGRALAKARDAWQASDEARVLANDITGPVGGQYLRNRLEVAFCAGYDAGHADAQSVAAGGEVAYSDERLIELCNAAGVRWIEPDRDETGALDPDGYPGGFDMSSMESMRALVAALSTQPAPSAPEVE